MGESVAVATVLTAPTTAPTEFEREAPLPFSGETACERPSGCDPNTPLLLPPQLLSRLLLLPVAASAPAAAVTAAAAAAARGALHIIEAAGVAAAAGENE